eukprot:365861-Chlamydomonas_euryale.AAC.11
MYHLTEHDLVAKQRPLECNLCKLGMPTMGESAGPYPVAPSHAGHMACACLTRHTRHTGEPVTPITPVNQ